MLYTISNNVPNILSKLIVLLFLDKDFEFFRRSKNDHNFIRKLSTILHKPYQFLHYPKDTRELGVIFLAIWNRQNNFLCFQIY